MKNPFWAMKQKPLLLAQEAPAPQITEVAILARVLSLYACPVFYAFS